MSPTSRALAGLMLPAGLLVAGQTFAACTGPALDQTALTAALTGKTVCAARGSDRWQEYHAPGGMLIDYKRGPNDKLDPSEQVGTWSITANPAGNNANVVYNYGAGGSFSYTARANGGSSYSLCGRQDFEVMVLQGQVACP